jgi:hypothetical protein
VRIYPQPSFLDAFRKPVTVELALPAGQAGPGPSDPRIYTVLPLGKTIPYGPGADRLDQPTRLLPPWQGPHAAPALPDAHGHFDHLAWGTPGFVAAHAWGCARFVLEIWEGYCGPIPWHFRRIYPRLELCCLTDYENAQCGFGYLELGVNRDRRRPPHPFALNFDVIAHEMGHLILFSLLGLPHPAARSAEFRGFHEGMADLVALVAAAHLDAVVDEVLENTHGNLYVANELNRFAELSASEEIRTVSNGVKLSEFEEGWADEHDLSLPLTGAVFDILVEVYQLLLVRRGLLDPRAVDLADTVERSAAFRHPLDAMYGASWTRFAPAMKTAFGDARDLVARWLALVWPRLDPNGPTYAGVGRAILAADAATTGGRFRHTIVRSFDWRSIWTSRVGPLLTGLPKRSHISSSRTAVPGVPGQAPFAPRPVTYGFGRP